MKKFMVLYFADSSAQKKMNTMPKEEKMAEMQKWMDWAKKCDKHLIDMGSPFVSGHKITPDGSEPSKRNIYGYSLLQATSLSEAKKFLRAHPHIELSSGCDVEIYEFVGMPG